MPLDCWERSSAADSADTCLHDLLSMPGNATYGRSSTKTRAKNAHCDQIGMIPKRLNETGNR
jgi:hypothetical protein